MKSKEKIAVGLNLSDSSTKHGDDDVVPRLRRTKSIFVSPANKCQSSSCTVDIFVVNDDKMCLLQWSKLSLCVTGSTRTLP